MGEDGEGRGGRFGCTCLAPCPGPIDQTAELAKGKGGGRERRKWIKLLFFLDVRK